MTLPLPLLRGVMVAALCWGAAVSAFAQGAAVRVPEGIAYERDVEYGRGGEQRLYLDLARPQQLAEPTPCIVVIHGGAWRAGDKRGHTDLVLKLAQAGYVAATVQYRFCPDNPFPAQVEDVKCAVRFLRAHAEKYGIDASRLGSVGFSAGAHLAMLLGVMGPNDGLEGDGGWAEFDSNVQAVVGFFGPTDLTANDLPTASQQLVKDLLGGSVNERLEAYKAASPVYYVSKGDAPMLLFQGTRDPLVPHTQAYRMIEALTKAEVPARVELLVGQAHGFAGAELNHTVEQSFKFFDQRLQKGARRPLGR